MDLAGGGHRGVGHGGEPGPSFWPRGVCLHHRGHFFYQLSFVHTFVTSPVTVIGTQGSSALTRASMVSTIASLTISRTFSLPPSRPWFGEARDSSRWAACGVGFCRPWTSYPRAALPPRPSRLNTGRPASAGVRTLASVYAGTPSDLRPGAFGRGNIGCVSAKKSGESRVK